MALKDWEQNYGILGWDKIKIKSISLSELHKFRRKDGKNTLNIYAINESVTKVITTQSMKIFRGYGHWNKSVKYALAYMKKH